MPAPELVLCIDIGGDSLKAAEFSFPQGGGIILERFAFSEYGGDLKEEELLDALSSAMADIFANNGFEAKRVHISISGQSAFVRFVKLPPVGEEEERVRQIVEYEAKQNVPFPMDEVVWDYQLIRGAEDESEIEVMFVVIKNEVVERINNILETLGRQAAVIEIAPTACYNASRANGVGENDCEMILNIGGRCSSLVFIDNGRFFVRSIPIAGHSVTQQIAKEFGIPFADAEEMKRRHGFVALGGAYEEPDSEVAATVSKIVRNVMTRLHGEINRSINVYRSQQKGRKPEKLFLAGGSSVMAFTPRFFSEKLRIPVDYFNPFQVVSLAPCIDKEGLAEVAHMFSEVIGLALRYATVCPIEITLLPDAVRKQNELRLKIPYFYASAVSLVLCLGILLWGVSRQQSVNEQKARLAHDEVAKINVLRGDINKAIEEKGRFDSYYNDARKILDQRKQWVELCNELQRVLPDHMWLTKIKGVQDTSVAASATPVMAEPVFAFGPRPTGKQGGGGPKSDIQWVQLEGHSLAMSKSASAEEDFRANLMKSDMFTKNKDDIKTVKFTPAKGNNNLTEFKVEVKLKNPIKR
ncbi:MAG: hypothetical protein A2X49_06365 [Lentisphaerae bacterium GWF2_52_8]|nr:MAG: hypothetical protein A2X49_06365 [Lentisphaerae bacterium GWF2_52_8]